MPHAELDDVSLWYLDEGRGTPIVFMHAASGTSESFANQFPAFTAKGYRALAYDRRGWGRTKTTKGDAENTEFVVDFLGFLDALKLEKVHLVGQAAGGGPVPDIALTCPERLRSIVISGSVSGIQHDAEYKAFLARVRTPEITALPVELRELSPSYRGLHPEGVKKWLAMEHMTRGADHDGKPQYYVLRQQYRHKIDLAMLEKIRVPAMVMVGDADLVTPPAQMRMVASHIPGAEFRVVPDAGHATSWEQPEAWNRIVLEFIGRH